MSGVEPSTGGDFLFSPPGVELRFSASASRRASISSLFFFSSSFFASCNFRCCSSICLFRSHTACVMPSHSHGLSPYQSSSVHPPPSPHSLPCDAVLFRTDSDFFLFGDRGLAAVFFFFLSAAAASIEGFRSRMSDASSRNTFRMCWQSSTFFRFRSFSIDRGSRTPLYLPFRSGTIFSPANDSRHLREGSDFLLPNTSWKSARLHCTFSSFKSPSEKCWNGW
mmetsp:Transcript_13887/g.34292  ORF Transcript_13887/g.34292 Transcript_13887/m.34292 type:complete len:223 (-) Transcript_13887:768-1436(-)